MSFLPSKVRGKVMVPGLLPRTYLPIENPTSQLANEEGNWETWGKLAAFGSFLPVPLPDCFLCQPLSMPWSPGAGNNHNKGPGCFHSMQLNNHQYRLQYLTEVSDVCRQCYVVINSVRQRCIGETPEYFGMFSMGKFPEGGTKTATSVRASFGGHQDDRTGLGAISKLIVQCLSSFFWQACLKPRCFPNLKGKLCKTTS